MRDLMPEMVHDWTAVAARAAERADLIAARAAEAADAQPSNQRRRLAADRLAADAAALWASVPERAADMARAAERQAGRAGRVAR